MVLKEPHQLIDKLFETRTISLLVKETATPKSVGSQSHG